MRKVRFRFAIAFFALAVSTGCSTFKGVGGFFGIGSQKPAVPKNALTEDEARERSRGLSNIGYTLDFEFDEKMPVFRGQATVSFDFSEKVAASRIFLDLNAARVQSVVINAQPWNAEAIKNAYDGTRISLASGGLKKGRNEVKIVYQRDYVTDGNGLHRFVDPVDQRVYLYTHFEPFFANRVFPCFDQPDLKATYKMTVRAPRNWEVVSNERETEVSSDESFLRWNFPSTKPFSTYLFALHAGPYTFWKSRHGRIPLRLFARQSIARYVDFVNWFEVTEKGFSWFQKEFDYPYPFSKYDQVIVPDFNMGAMENVGAVTFSERYVQRSRMTYEQKRQRANVVLHEMAHMWFGNLVTMTWWNGLWLNESFATYLASVASDRALALEGVWESFLARSKISAFREDSYSTNHPVETVVDDTDAAFAQFDAITYGKGASILKQLHFRVGDQGFFGGLRAYFKKYAFKNATISDFISSIEAASKQNLSEFRKEWLESRGFERLRPVWKCDKGKVTDFVFEQLASSQSDRKHRTHRFLVGLYYPDPGEFYRVKTFTVQIKDREEKVKTLIGQDCPVWVHPNVGDYGHFISELDSTSLEEVQSQVHRIGLALNRLSVLHSIWDRVRLGESDPDRYLRDARRHLYREPSLVNLDFLTSTLYRLQLSGITAIRLVNQSEFSRKIQFLEEAYADLLAAADQGSDEQKFWFSRFASIAQSPARVAELEDILNGAKQLPGFSMDQDQRWELVQAIARHGGEDADRYVENETLRDPSDKGQKEKLVAMASKPDPINKTRWWSAFTLSISELDKNLRIANVRQAMKGYYNIFQERFAVERSDAFFSDLPRVRSNRGDFYAETFAEYLYPSICDRKNADRTREFLSSRSDELSEELRRTLTKRMEDERDCALVRERH